MLSWICFVPGANLLYVLQLEEKIREKVNEEYKEKISFQDECDLFVRLVNLAIIGRVVLIPLKRRLHCHHRDGQRTRQRL